MRCIIHRLAACVGTVRPGRTGGRAMGRAFADLPDHVLNDIGVSRCDAVYATMPEGRLDLFAAPSERQWATRRRSPDWAAASES
jgi:hypothetical protein